MRNQTIDIVKGMGIILVVLAHAIGKNSTDALLYYDYGLFNVISSFFMPMFMIISGYLVYGKIGDWVWVKKHTTKWFIPLVIFTVIYWLAGNFVPDIMDFFSLYGIGFIAYIYHIIISGFSGLVLWCLWTIILCYPITYLLERSRIKIKIPLIFITVLFAVVINFIPITMFGFFTVKWYGLFFLLGYTLHHYKLNGKLAYVSLVVFPLCSYLFNWMIPYQNQEYGCFGLASIVPAINNGYGGLVAIMGLMALSGSAFVYSLARLIRWQPVMNLFSYLGSISIGVYLIHIVFVGIASNYWLAALLATIISVGLYEVLKRSPYVNFLLFGGDIPIRLKTLGGWYDKAKV
ncbi:MAG: acyltransferase family protein [Dehalococcoidales bacterium]|nr:acyltransferase family protein [Dehalococcoidales bacterium]